MKLIQTDDGLFALRADTSQERVALEAIAGHPVKITKSACRQATGSPLRPPAPRMAVSG